jgi:2'-5' RNA ligase
MVSLTAAADGSHLSGAMIALMPTVEDAERLAIEGGEAADELHLTLSYLGNGDDFDEETRSLIIDSVRSLAEGMPLVRSNLFGAAHWNANTEKPSWVWNVGDDPEYGRSLEAAHEMAYEALRMSGAGLDVPERHSPWAAHLCAAYSDELDLIIALEERLGPVTFDRVRVEFSGDHTDVPLGGGAVEGGESAYASGGLIPHGSAFTFRPDSGYMLPARAVRRFGLEGLTASGPLRRQPTEVELASRADFAAMDKAWRDAVEATVEAWADIQEAQRKQITAAVQTAAEADDLDRLDEFAVDTSDGAALLIARMIAYAREAGEQQQAEAEAQGVTVPDWSLDDEALTAAAIRDRLRQMGRTAARVLGVGLVQSAVRQAMRVWGSGSSEQVAAQVDEHLAALSGATVEEQVGAAMTAAQNEGRMAVLAVAPPAEYVATEILDSTNTCKPCRQIDGTRYTTLPDARAAYPTGGYTGCLGGARCRGTLVTVWPQDSEQAAAGMILAASAATMPPTHHEGGGAVPYRIEQNHPDCGADTPWAVIQEGTDELMGCHPSEAAALEQQAALYAEEGDGQPADDGDESMDYTGKTAPWRGPLAIEGQVTGDGREFAPDALTWAELPVPLRWNKEDSHGGEARTIAVNVGRIDKIWRDGSLIMGEGVLDLSDDDGRKVYGKIEGKFLRGVSIDADSISDADVEFVWPDDANEGTEDGGEDDLFEMLFAQPEKMIFHGGRIRAATLVDIPAFAEAYIALLDEEGAVVAGGQPIGAEAIEAAAVQKPKAPRAVVASVTEPWRAPAAWFADPKLSLPTPITITDEGRIYGHAAQWGTCHIGQEGTCIQPPHEDAHPYYRTGEVVCEGGERMAVGQITVGTGHAPLHLGASPAAEHYDNTGAAVADVAVGNDQHGIWVAGSVRPGADPLKVYELQAAGQVSGDWRRIGGQLRLVGLLAVNVPGFPVPKMRARVASGQPQALVAAGRPQVARGRSQADVEQEAMRVVMRMLSRRTHPGGR